MMKYSTTRQTTMTRRAFAFMLKVKRELTRDMLTYGEGRFTILEVSEDNASIVIARALMAAERRGAKAEHRRIANGKTIVHDGRG